jgi:NAD(P)H-dependent FMN reductase/ketosteroid isomerase-like protein
MSESTRVAMLIGSLRAKSFSRRVARALGDCAPPSLSCHIVEIGDLPLYNEDLEGDRAPDAWKRFRSGLRASDAVLFVTPEYNRSIPGALKNALDVGSRPPKANVFAGKPAGVVSVTPYKLGAFGANHAIRQTFVFLDMPVMQQPEMYLREVGDAFDDQGKPKDGETARLLERFMGAFETWVGTIRAANAGTRFPEFMTRREAIARDYVNGDASSLASMVTKTDPATFFAPNGDQERGAAAVKARYEHDAGAFRGGTTELEVLQSAASGGLAFWTGLQRATVRMGDETAPKTMTLRITEVFRYEGGAYTLVHRHADARTGSEGASKR